MTKAESKAKKPVISVNLPNNFFRHLDKACAAIGVSKSAFGTDAIAVYVREIYESSERIVNMIDSGKITSDDSKELEMYRAAFAERMEIFEDWYMDIKKKEIASGGIGLAVSLVEKSLADEAAGRK